MLWHTSYTNRETVAATTLAGLMQAVHECASPLGQRTFATFDRFNGLDEAIIAALEPAAQKALGWRFTGLEKLYKTPVCVLPDRYNDNAVALLVNFRVGYRLIDLNDASNHVKVFRIIADSLREQITARYPDAKVGLQHSGCYKNFMSLHLTVTAEPEMSLAVAA